MRVAMGLSLGNARPWGTVGEGLVLAAAWALTGCGDAIASDGSIQGVVGGVTLDAAEELSPELPPAECTDAGSPGSSCSGANVCCGAELGGEICAFDGESTGTCKVPAPLGTGSTFTELYADYFGGTGRAACAGNGSCHGSTSALGYATFNYLCPPNDQDTCYKSMTSSSLGLLTTGLTFDKDYLFQVLRKPQTIAGSTINNMPLSPTQVYVFSPADLSRIAAWVAAGAPND